MRHMGLALAALALIGLHGCSDDDDPPFYPDGVGKDAGDGGPTGDVIYMDKGNPWDGFDPKCPMPGPCVLEKKGEGKHPGDYLVIGEIMTLSGKELDSVTTVFVGAADAPIVNKSASQLTCRIGPKTPPGQQTIELQANDKRRMSGVIEIRRLVAVSSSDDTKLQTFLAATHSGGPTIDMGEQVDGRPSVGPSGRYLVAPAAAKLVVVDLAQETVGTVAGLTEAAASWAIDDKVQTLAVATSSGKLLSVDLSTFPTLTAKAVTGAPGAAAVVLAEPGLFAGLNPAGTQGSIWYAKTDLKTFTFAEKGGSPLVIGSGTGLKALSTDARDGRVAFLVQDGSSTHLALATVAAGALSDATSLTMPAENAVVAQGGTYVALGVGTVAPQMGIVDATTPSQKTLALGSGSGTSVVAGALPTLQDTAFALVGPSASPFKADRVELVDLKAAKRLTVTGGKPAVELGDLRAAVADPITGKVHLISGTHFHSFILSVSTSALTVTEQHPKQQLTPGKTPAWVVVQP